MADEFRILDGDELTVERVRTLPWIHQPSTYRFDRMRWRGTTNGPVLALLSGRSTHCYVCGAWHSGPIHLDADGERVHRPGAAFRDGGLLGRKPA